MRLLRLDRKFTDSIDVERREMSDGRRDTALLMKCQHLWTNMEKFRIDRERALRFTCGDQWGDLITVDGKTMTQREYVTSVGNVAFQTNQIKKIVNTIAGVWEKEQNELVARARDRDEQQYGELMTTVLQANCQLNRMNLLFLNCIEEALIGGACFARESFELRNGKMDSWTDICNPNYMFFDSEMKDPRFWDATLVGEIHDIGFKELCAKFCGSDADVRKMRDLYSPELAMDDWPSMRDPSEKHGAGTMSFFTPSDPRLCRVVEVWTKEIRARYRVHDPNSGELYVVDADDAAQLREIEHADKARLEAGARLGWAKEEIPVTRKEYFIDTYWYCRFLTPHGDIIWEGESPYANNTHPYSICAMPFTGGKISGFISDAIDQNMAINRALMLDDWIKRAGSKGVWMIPKSLVPNDMDEDDFARQWTSIDGIIYYEPKPNVPEPKAFYGNTQQLNTTDIVRMMSDLMESGVAVSGALQGKTPYAGTSAALYAQQTQNSSTPIATFMARFGAFAEDVGIKKLGMVRRFYDEKKYRLLAGRSAMEFPQDFDYSNMSDVEYDLSVKQSTETPVYRMIANDYLKEFWASGQIMLEDYLELADLPFSDRLLQKIQARNASAGQQGQPPLPEFQQMR